MRKNILYLFLFCCGLPSQMVFAEPLAQEQRSSSLKTFISPNKKLTLIYGCSVSLLGDCFFYGKKSGKKVFVVEDIRNRQARLSWIGNIARVDAGGCGSSCFRTVYVNEHLKKEEFVNPIALDKRNMCIAYPYKNEIVFRKLFSKNIGKTISFKDYPDLDIASYFALAKGIVHNNGDISISFNSDNDKGEMEKIALRIPNPCEEKKASRNK